MIENMPVVDILLATHNGEEFLREQLESIKLQTYQDWRVLISDDSSTDGTRVIMREYCERDSRFSVVSHGQVFGGSKENFFNLLKYSTNEYVMFCDQDDVWLDDKIEVSLKAMRACEGETGHSCPILVFTDAVVVDDRLQIIAPSFHKHAGLHPDNPQLTQLIVANSAAGNSMMVNRSLADMLREADDVESICMHDWYAMLLASAFGRIEYLSVPTLLYRQHGGNVIGANKLTLTDKLRNRFSSINSTERNKRLQRERECAVQAASFLRQYGSRLPVRSEKQLEEYVAAIGSKSFAKGIVHLFRSGCWKVEQTERIGQVIHRLEYSVYAKMVE